MAAARERTRLSRVFFFGLFFGAMCLGGCGPGRPPKNLFTIEAEHADYPVMLSQAPAAGPGRRVAASSGRHAAASQWQYPAGRTTVTITNVERSESELSASEKLAAQIQRNDKWLQIDHAEYRAMDFLGPSSSSSDRNLTVEGTVHR
jgi:hypothetical protein